MQTAINQNNILLISCRMFSFNVFSMKSICAAIYILLFTVLISSCKQDATMFRLVSSDRSNIHFNNKIVENDSINPIDVTNIYNGGVVGVGDFNGYGLQDLYFTGSMVSNKLYLNKGKLAFEDITNSAGVSSNGK